MTVFLALVLLRYIKRHSKRNNFAKVIRDIAVSSKYHYVNSRISNFQDKKIDHLWLYGQDVVMKHILICW